MASNSCGGILVGDAEDYGIWLQMMLNALPLRSNTGMHGVAGRSRCKPLNRLA